MSGKTTYDRERALGCCERLIEEPNLGLAAILREAGIARTTWRDWRKANPELDAAYKEAKEIGYDELAQQCIQIAEDKSGDIKMGKDGPVFDMEHVQRSKLRIETRLKLLAKWSGKYADKVMHSNDPEKPFGRMSDEEIDARIRGMLGGEQGNG